MLLQTATQAIGGANSTTDPNSTAVGSVGGVSSAGSDTTQISSRGQLLADLQQLQTQDPAKFQQVVTQIAQELQAAAQQQGQTPQGQFLSNLAAKFQNVATTGDLSQLRGHHGHHHGYSGGTASGIQTLLNSDPTQNSNNTSADNSDNLQQLFGTIRTQVQQALTP